MLWHVEGKQCCKECFAHEWLREYVSSESRKVGTCQYCGKSRAKLIDVAKLARPFENLMAMYSWSEFGGDPIIDLVQGDWEVFNESFYDRGLASKLFEDVWLASWDDDSGEGMPDANAAYARKTALNLVDNWEEFLYEDKEEPDFSDIVLEDLAPYEASVRGGAVLYRARIGWSGQDKDGRRQAWQGKDIGPNPEGPPGRANFKGEVVLYCADQERTSVAEVRPARGHLVSVSTLEVIRDFGLRPSHWRLFTEI